MQIAAKRNLVLKIVSSLSQLGRTPQAVEQDELYQHITFALMEGEYRKRLADVTNELIAVADHAIGIKQSKVAEDISKILINSPLSRGYRNIGRYYHALSIKKRVGVSTVNTILENVASSSATPLQYRARALQAIGGNHFDSGNVSEGLCYFLEANRAASSKYGSDLLTVTLSQWMMAVIRSIDGDHKGALEALENLSPFVRLIAPTYPHYYYFYANALAVEWGEAGRIEEAQHACRIALASPYASFNPEWHETARELEQKARSASRSVVAINRNALAADNSLPVLSDPPEDQSSLNQAERREDNLIVFPSSHDRPARGSVDPFDRVLTASDLRWMTTTQKRSLVIEIVQSAGASDEILERMIKASGVVSGDESDGFHQEIAAPSSIAVPEAAIISETGSEELSGGTEGDYFSDQHYLEIIIGLLKAILDHVSSPQSEGAPTA